VDPDAVCLTERAAWRGPLPPGIHRIHDGARVLAMRFNVARPSLHTPPLPSTRHPSQPTAAAQHAEQFGHVGRRVGRGGGVVACATLAVASPHRCLPRCPSPIRHRSNVTVAGGGRGGVHCASAFDRLQHLSTACLQSNGWGATTRLLRYLVHCSIAPPHCRACVRRASSAPPHCRVLVWQRAAAASTDTGIPLRHSCGGRQSSRCHRAPRRGHSEGRRRQKCAGGRSHGHQRNGDVRWVQGRRRRGQRGWRRQGRSRWRGSCLWR
jgi:hypothetical protein